MGMIRWSDGPVILAARSRLELEILLVEFVYPACFLWEPPRWFLAVHSVRAAQTDCNRMDWMNRYRVLRKSVVQLDCR